MNLNVFMADKTSTQPVTDFFHEQLDVHIPEGERNSTLSRFAGRIIKRYGNTGEAREMFLQKAKLCDPPLDVSELKTIWSSAVKFGEKISSQEGYVPPEQFNNPTPRKPDDYSDVGQAYAFANHCRGYVRYSPATDYVIYDGICWQESKPRSQAAMQQFTDEQLKEAESWLVRTEERMEETGANDVVALHGKNAIEFMNKDQQTAFFAHQGAASYRKFVLQHRDSKYQVAALREARPMVEIDPSELDTDGFLLNTPDYTVDLRKGIEGFIKRPSSTFTLLMKKGKI